MQQPQQLALLPAIQHLPQRLPQPTSTHHLQLLQAVQQLHQLVQLCHDSHVLRPSVQRLVQCVHQQLPPDLQVHQDTRLRPQELQVFPAAAHTMVQQQQQQQQPPPAAAAGSSFAAPGSAGPTDISAAATSNSAGSGSAAVRRDTATITIDSAAGGSAGSAAPAPADPTCKTAATTSNTAAGGSPVVTSDTAATMGGSAAGSSAGSAASPQQIAHITQQLLLAAQQQVVQQLSQATQQPPQVIQQHLTQQQVAQHLSNADQMTSTADTPNQSSDYSASQLCKKTFHGLLQHVQHRQQKLQADAQQMHVTGGRAPGALVTLNKSVCCIAAAIKRMYPFPTLKAFQTIAQLHQVVMHVDEMSEILSLADRE